MQSDGSCYPNKQLWTWGPSGWEVPKNKDGTFNKTGLISTLREDVIVSLKHTSLKYHLNAKHALVSEGSSSGMRQTTLTEQRRPLTKSSCDKLTSTVAKCTAKSCRPINIVEDKGFTEVLRVAMRDSSIKALPRCTIMTKIHDMYEAEKKKRKMTWLLWNMWRWRDHWTSVSNNNYLGVTAHLITDERK